MITYAQNFEDVMLWRALKKVKNGFYIDVGANDPIKDSVTKWFYEQGWSGINCEPNDGCYERLCVDRPRDINIHHGIGSVVEDKIYFEIVDGNGLSTFDAAIANVHKKKGYKVVERVMHITTLSKVCEEYVGVKPIQFLKIDVEGFEGNVLKGMDFYKYRPWILCIESTFPNTQELTIEWEKDLLEKDYSFVYFDGLSRFYIAREKLIEFKDAFFVGPNVFDGFICNEQVILQNDNDDLVKKIKY